MRLRRHFLHFNVKDSRTVKGRLVEVLYSAGPSQQPWAWRGVHGGQQDYGRGGVDDGLAEVEGSSSVMVAVSRCLPDTLPSTPGDGGLEPGPLDPAWPGRASIRVIHPLRVMLLHPGLAIT